MKKTDTLQLTILVIGLITGYYALQTLPQIIWYFYYYISQETIAAIYLQSLFLNLIYLILYILGSLLLIKYSKRLSQYIAKIASFNNEVHLPVTKNNLLVIALIGIGIHMIIPRISKLSVKVYDYFYPVAQNSFYNNLNPTPYSDTMPMLIIELVLAVLVVVYSKNIVLHLNKLIHEINDKEISFDKE